MGKYSPSDPDSFTREDMVRIIDFSLLKPEETFVGYAGFVKTAIMLSARSGEWEIVEGFIRATET